MTEGRLCQIHLLDGRKLELLVQPKLLSRDLLDLVASHFNLKEKEYFGLCFIDDHDQNNWLQLDRKVLDHAFSKTSGPLEVKFLVRFYVEKINLLKENTTVELFFLNAKSLVFNETIEVESENVFKLAAFALQEARGDYTSAEAAASDLQQLPVLPTRVLREHPSLNYCEERVIEHYKKLKGVTRGQAVVKYLGLVESLPTYGVHYYPVKDKQGIPWWLGVSYKGIGQYDLQDKLKPRKLFQWKQLENLYFREKKFAVEVNDPHRRAVTKRTFGQAGLVIHSWYASHSLIKTIWAMAISQHQFYLDMKQTKSNMTTARSTGDIAVHLTEISTPRISKLSSVESNHPLIMASNGSLISTGSADSEVSEEQKKEKIAELKKKQKDLEEALGQKLEELKKICMKEAELTGQVPKEYPLAPGEKAPQVPRRVGTAFRLDDLNVDDKDPYLRELENKRALQQKIVEAAEKLFRDGLEKTVKRKRKKNYEDSVKKLREIEMMINEHREQTGRRATQRASLIVADDAQRSDLSSLSDSLPLDDDDEPGSQRERSRSVQYSPRMHHAEAQKMFYTQDRRASANDQLSERRLTYEQVCYSHSDALSSYSSPLKQQCRQPCDARSMPPTPRLHRNALSSTQLRSEEVAQHFHQRSGSLESLSHHATETKPAAPSISVSHARRCNSTEIIDDGSSHTSQSSAEYLPPGNHSHRWRARGRHRQDPYANTGSMPNLAQPDVPRYAAYQPQGQPTPTAYYVTGYPSHLDPEPYPNRVYRYDDGMEGHYNVNPSYHHTQAAYYRRDFHSHYATDEIDAAAQRFATLQPPRSRPVQRNTEQITKNIQKALVVGHLKEWYQRNNPHHQGTYNYDYDRGSTPSLGYQAMPTPYPPSHRNISYSSASSSGNWRMNNRGMSDYDVPVHESFSYTLSPAPYIQPPHSRCLPETQWRSFDRMTGPAGPLERFAAVAHATDQIKIPPLNISHSRQERILHGCKPHGFPNEQPNTHHGPR
ncbi:FERM domain-containing protein 4B isoform X3 [Fundulus heteroclitus]|nr:FERM domain-containing protein 4B isoform X3 [Fundulus heteroclitus]